MVYIKPAVKKERELIVFTRPKIRTPITEDDVNRLTCIRDWHSQKGSTSSEKRDRLRHAAIVADINSVLNEDHFGHG